MWPVGPRHKLKLSVNMIRKCSCREERHVFPSTHFLQALHRQRPRQQLRSPDEDKSKPLSPSTHDELLIKCKHGPSQPFVPVAATKFRMSWCFSKMSKLSHFKHLMYFYEVLMLLQQRSFDPVFDELMSFQMLLLLFIFHTTLLEHSFVFSPTFQLAVTRLLLEPQLLLGMGIV